MDYSFLVPLVADILKASLPIGIMFVLVERAVQMFFYFAFPKTFKN